MTDSCCDWQIVGHFHLYLLPLELQHVRVPVDGRLAGVADPVDGAGLGGQLAQLHGLAERVPQRDPLLDRHAGPPVVAEVGAEIGLGRGTGTAAQAEAGRLTSAQDVGWGTLDLEVLSGLAGPVVTGYSINLMY